MKKFNNLIMPMSSTATTGFAAESTKVYHGPDASVYASVGTIGPNETVNILATSMGWYHVEYSVGSTTQRKTGYVPESSLSNISGATISEEDFYGGYCYASTELDVRTCDVFANTAPVGTLYKNEGCTFLFSYLVNGKNIAFIEYSSPSGTKRGYVYSDYLKFPCETIVCIAKEKLPVYGSPDFNRSAQLGTIYENELMGVVAKEGNVIYVEYNTVKGRKRGYVDWTKINPRDYVSGTIFNDFYKTPNNSTCHIVDESVPVYGGPSTSYAQIGSVNYENITCFWTYNAEFPLTCIEYIVTKTGLAKRGYIDPSKVVDGGLTLENNPIESFENSYSFFGNKIVYGKTQLDRDMFYYKAGNGKNHLFLLFAQHGWEDGKTSTGSYKHGDGNMLLKIAKDFISRFIAMDSTERNTILNNWTIFLFPGINLDGIVNGYSNNGFGRCFYNGIDPNRSWAGNFEEYTDPRNKTSPTYFNAIELVNLKKVLTANIGEGKNIALDIHGWENSFITKNLELAAYYVPYLQSIDPNFHRKTVSKGSGYFITWASNSPETETTNSNMAGLGAISGLLEFPPTNDYSDTNMQRYGNEFFKGTKNLLLDNSSGSVTVGENDETIKKLTELYKLASDYFDDDATVKECNILVLNYLRHLAYNGISWTVTAKEDVNSAFVNYVINNAIQDLDPKNMKIYVRKISDKIDVAHLAVTTETMMNNNDSDYRNLAGWAGDLIQLAGNIEKKYSSDSSKYNYSVEQLKKLIGCSGDLIAETLGFENVGATGFELQDLIQDVDAINLSTLLEQTPIYTVIKEYYDNGGDLKRFTNFYNKVKSYSQYTSESGDNSTTIMKKIAHRYTDKELDVLALVVAFQVKFGIYEARLWGEKLSQAFAEKIIDYMNKE